MEAEMTESEKKHNTRWGNAEKNKAISAWVDRERYDEFTKINKARGLSNNKAINILIADYVLEYKHLVR